MPRKPPGKTLNAYRVPVEQDTLHLVLRERMKQMISDQWHELTARERIALLAAIARIEVLFPKIRESSYVPIETGATVRKYEKAFASNAVGQRKPDTGADADGLLEDDTDELEY